MKQKAALLAIGTELTTAQIANSNAVHLTKLLQRMGVCTGAHLTVPDDRQVIRDALDFLTREFSLVILTGGLGPTSDDFTRVVLSDWLNTHLVFNESSWEWIQSRLSERGVPVREAHRSQAFYPESSRIWLNTRGTAHGFSVSTKKGLGSEIVCLPGPPKEIESVWQSGLERHIDHLTRTWPRTETLSWDTLGVGESEIAHLAEEATAECGTVERGYRVHFPYVEFKLTYYQTNRAALLPTIERVEKALAPYTICRNGEDLAEKLATLLSATHRRAVIVDTLTGVFLFRRLSPFFSGLLNKKSLVFAQKEIGVEAHDVLMTVHPAGPSSAWCSLYRNGQKRELLVEHPYQRKVLFERGLQHVVEKSLQFWVQQLAGCS